MTEASSLRTVKALARELQGTTGAISESILRWLMFNRSHNGLDRCVIQVGRRLLIDVRGFNAWLDAQRPGSTRK